MTHQPPLRVPADNRHIGNGLLIPAENYSDQPYLVSTDDGAWLCVLTTGSGEEGNRGQHVVTRRTMDQGRTWIDFADVEPSSGPEASFAVAIKAPGGRIYVFYTYNVDDIRSVRADDPPYAGGQCPRVDSLGSFVFKYSDDHGKSWSAKRYPIFVRETEIDRSNAYGGKVRLFWNVGRPFFHGGAVYVPLHKVHGFGHGFFTRTEGWLLRSEDLFSSADPATVRWETLPKGELGLRAPPGAGPISEEQSFVVLSDSTFYCVWRTTSGHPVFARSRDGGYTWTPAAFQAYADGRLMKHPRAANFVWRCLNGKFLYWFHNHGGTSYEDRNPAWICGGQEVDTSDGKTIAWSQPEILLYDDDPYIRMSYPDFLEEKGGYFLTETQKATPRLHRLDPTLLEGLWDQFGLGRLARDGIAGDSGPKPSAAEFPINALPPFLSRDEDRPDYGARDYRSGIAVECWIDGSKPILPGTVLLSNRTDDGKGFTLKFQKGSTLELAFGDGRVESSCTSDEGSFPGQGRHHVVVIVDGGPKIVLFVVDGQLNDGGRSRQFGWSRFNPHLRGLQGRDSVRLESRDGGILRARVYSRAIRVSEAVGNYKAGPQA